MKIKNRIWIYQLLIVGILLTIINSCKKEEPIIKKDGVITWSNPADIVVGTPLSATQLNATTDVPGTFVYTPAIGTVLSVGENQDLKVDFIPTDAVNNNTSTKTVTISVTKIIPVITWANPADIIAVTALSGTQLNATADVAGTFVYTPAIGTVLSVEGSQNLKVDFTPTDNANYNAATKTVTINVNPITDYDGNIYHAVVIGTQTWMVENLKVTHYRNGDVIQYVTDNNAWSVLTTGAYCWYNNVISNKATYGALYNWYAVSDSRNIAPPGWHVPTDAEWTTLATFLGGQSLAGGKMKSTGTIEAGTGLWHSPNTGADNSSSFTALPGSMRGYINGGWGNMGEDGYYWSSTSDVNVNYAYCLRPYFASANAFRQTYGKAGGLSVRCVQD